MTISSPFNEHGCVLKGFAHEAVMTPYKRDPKSVWPGVLDSVLREFDRGLNQTAFSMADTTICIWRKYEDDRWHRGEITFPEIKLRFDGKPRDPDGSGVLLSLYDGKPETYLEWAAGHFAHGFNGENLTLGHVRHVYAHKPLTAKLVKEINPELTLTKLKADIEEIGYPRSKK